MIGYPPDQLHQEIMDGAAALEKALEAAPFKEGNSKLASYFGKRILPLMAALRSHCDEAEQQVARAHWPFPCYSELLGNK